MRWKSIWSPSPSCNIPSSFLERFAWEWTTTTTTTTMVCTLFVAWAICQLVYGSKWWFTLLSRRICPFSADGKNAMMSKMEANILPAQHQWTKKWTLLCDICDILLKFGRMRTTAIVQFLPSILIWRKSKLMPDWMIAAISTGKCAPVWVIYFRKVRFTGFIIQISSLQCTQQISSPRADEDEVGPFSVIHHAISIANEGKVITMGLVNICLQDASTIPWSWTGLERETSPR